MGAPRARLTPGGQDRGMPGPHAATAAIRVAVRSALDTFARGDLVLVALSGGADSLALASAVSHEAPGRGVVGGALVVDHGLQEGSVAVATRAVEQASTLGLCPAEVVRAPVTLGSDGLEAAARAVRYRALDEAAARHGAAGVLLAHTQDDQAEQVLLGLARGSGSRSLAGMPDRRGLFVRPLLGITRAQTQASCAAQGLAWWDDPMNEDGSFARVRARRLVRSLESELGPGIRSALARSARQVREDADLLDSLADVAFADVVDADVMDHAAGVTARPPSWQVPASSLAALPRAIRTRVWRRMLIAGGAPAGQVSSRHTDACDLLITAWRGQGPLHLPGRVRVSRAGHWVRLEVLDPPG